MFQRMNLSFYGSKNVKIVHFSKLSLNFMYIRVSLQLWTQRFSVEKKILFFQVQCNCILTVLLRRTHAESSKNNVVPPM